MKKRFELLRFNHAGAMRLKNGITVNYGVIRRDNGKLVYYTGKGLREIWSPNLSSEEKIKAERLKRMTKEKDGEEKLKDYGYIDITDLSDIDLVLF